MDKNNWNNIDEQDFDKILKDSLPEIPPEEIIKDVNPWRKAMKYVLVGMALNTMTLNFLRLNYILPAIGVILMLLGFKALRRDNKWFRLCWFITIIRAIYFFSMLIVNASIWHTEVFSHPFSQILTVLNLALIFLQFFCLWRGFLSIQKKAGLPEHAPGAIALMVWFLLLCLLAAIQYQGIIILLGLIFTYYFIFRSLFKLSKALDEAGYVVETVAVKISDRTLAIAIVTLLTIGISCSYLFFNSYPMQWKSVEASTNSEVAEIKENLKSLGFPAAILEDLTEDDILACKGALKVIVEVDEYQIDEYQVDEYQIDGYPIYKGSTITDHNEGVIHQYTVYDNIEELHITSIAVELPGDRKHLKLFHHFLWDINPGFYGTESIQLWPAYQRDESWAASGDLTGQILYNNGDTIYSAPYYSIGNETYTSTGIFFEEQTSTDIFATFSMPRIGEQHRGYVSYSLKEIKADLGLSISSWINYTHQRTWLQYPALTAMEQRKINSSNEVGAFRTIQKSMQFVPGY